MIGTSSKDFVYNEQSEKIKASIKLLSRGNTIANSSEVWQVIQLITK